MVIPMEKSNKKLKKSFLNIIHQVVNLPISLAFVTICVITSGSIVSLALVTTAVARDKKAIEHTLQKQQGSLKLTKVLLCWTFSKKYKIKKQENKQKHISESLCINLWSTWKFGTLCSRSYCLQHFLHLPLNGVPGKMHGTICKKRKGKVKGQLCFKKNVQSSCSELTHLVEILLTCHIGGTAKSWCLHCSPQGRSDKWKGWHRGHTECNYSATHTLGLGWWRHTGYRTHTCRINSRQRSLSHTYYFKKEKAFSLQ